MLQSTKKTKHVKLTTTSSQPWTWLGRELLITLKEINRKLAKLESIQKAVSEVQTTFHKLEVRIQNLESSQETASRDIDHLALCSRLRQLYEDLE